MSDIGADPDDQQSLVRQVLYANEIDIEGLVFGTSIWKRRVTAETLALPAAILDAYAEVQPNLRLHDARYPSADELRARVRTGHSGYGMNDVGAGKTASEGVLLIIAAMDREDERPLWITVWGGANTLAEALYIVSTTRDAAALARLTAKRRVYAISDQDDAGPWIRGLFPTIPYLVSPACTTPCRVPCQGLGYARATWSGISGEVAYRKRTVNAGPDSTLITADWLRTHIQSKGPLGAVYPDTFAIMEGESPAWMGLIANGLDSAAYPTWGGRYIKAADADVPSQLYTQRSGSADRVLGKDGRLHRDEFATIYRWRRDYQYDFANRMDWTIKPDAEANHAPQPVTNGDAHLSALQVTAAPGAELTLDATASTDPDDDAFDCDWFVDPEALSPGATAGKLTLACARGYRFTASVRRAGETLSCQ